MKEKKDKKKKERKMGRKGGERKKAGRGNERAINAPQPYAGRGVAGFLFRKSPTDTNMSF